MKLVKIEKELGKELLTELDSLGDEGLKNTIIVAEQSINSTREELDANPNYIKAKEDAKALSQGFREVKKRQNAKIQYALLRLQGLGKL